MDLMVGCLEGFVLGATLDGGADSGWVSLRQTAKKDMLFSFSTYSNFHNGQTSTP
jgi:hypothetical protein